MNFEIFIKRGEDAELKKLNPILEDRDFIKVFFDNRGFMNGTDLFRPPMFVIGDGVHHYNELEKLKEIIIKPDTILKQYPINNESGSFLLTLHFDVIPKDKIGGVISYDKNDIIQDELNPAVEEQKPEEPKKKNLFQRIFKK